MATKRRKKKRTARYTLIVRWNGSEAVPHQLPLGWITLTMTGWSDGFALNRDDVVPEDMIDAVIDNWIFDHGPFKADGETPTKTARKSWHFAVVSELK